ncbi:amidohydrolase [Luminiphilus syltensis NOR5-1B]|uniref:Amidohydrolase n=1 Tax=Luminiphilus syltensis NOR5-1B TaxID=565045 RepID=B8KY23_9GAMM|nr:amidohydrolase family protein [Luminiphilus syltensis]EED36377.1 amidohydrolase [Luminiphilus syltensis NOR5-1B]
MSGTVIQIIQSGALRRSARRFVIAVVSLTALLALPASAEPVAIVGGLLIDGNGGKPVKDATVLMEDGVVTAVGRRAEVDVPDGAKVIDAEGKTIMPGLADMHVHLVGGWDGVSVDMLGYQRYLNSLLYAGVTTVFDVGNIMPYIIQMRNEIAAGRLTGPRIYSVGALVDGPDPVWPPLAFALSSGAQIPGIVEQLAANGVDAIKAYTGLSVPQLRALVAEGKKHDLPVIVDFWNRTASYDAAATAPHAFAHLPPRPLSDEALDVIVNNDIHFQTTLAVKESFAFRRLDDLSFTNFSLIRDTSPPAFLEQLREYARSPRDENRVQRSTDRFEIGMASVPQLHKAGVMLVAGTDAPYPGVTLGEGLHRELELLVEAGLTPLEALQTATLNAARLMGDEEGWGTLAPGQRADVLLINGRPDRNISETRNIDLVIQRGVVLDRSALVLDPATDPGFLPGAAVDDGQF